MYEKLIAGLKRNLSSTELLEFEVLLNKIVDLEKRIERLEGDETDCKEK